MERDSAWGAIQPMLKIFSPAKRAWKSEKSHVIETEFQPGPKKERKHAHQLCFRTSVNFLTEICARAEIEHVITTFQPGGQSEISARAETHHVIRPLEKYNNGNFIEMHNQLHLLTIQFYGPHSCLLFVFSKFVVSKKTVVLCWWKRKTWKFGFIKRVGLCWIITVKDLESWCFHFVRVNWGIMGCCWFLLGCGRALLSVEIWWHEFVN